MTDQDMTWFAVVVILTTLIVLYLFVDKFVRSYASANVARIFDYICGSVALFILICLLVMDKLIS